MLFRSPVNKQPMDETRDDVVVLDTPQDTTDEMFGTQVPHHSGDRKSVV